MTIMMKKSNDPKVFMMKGMHKGIFMNKAKSEMKTMPIMYEPEEKKVKKSLLEK